MSGTLKPASNDDVLEAVKWAVAEKTPLEIVGQGSKRAIGKPMQTAHTLDMSGLAGVTLYEPDELVLSAKAGTLLAEIERFLETHNQELQFEPMNYGPLLGTEPGQGTIGGLLAANLCGPRRLKSGSARDHVLGINAVSGRGEAFKSGGRVVKNVTGYDLSKGLAGSWGTLAAVTDVTFKVLPKAETEQTLVLNGLSDADAARAMALATGSSAEVSAAAHLPDGLMDSGGARTILRLEGFETSVAYRMKKLADLLSEFGEAEALEAETSRNLWAKVRDVRFFAEDQQKPVWRISCTPTKCHAIVTDIRNEIAASAFYDWQGGLIWMQMDDRAHAETVRAAIARHGGGHATLIRADAAVRLETEIFQPQPEALAALSKRYRENFDPYDVLNPGRMG